MYLHYSLGPWVKPTDLPLSYGFGGTTHPLGVDLNVHQEKPYQLEFVQSQEMIHCLRPKGHLILKITTLYCIHVLGVSYLY